MQLEILGFILLIIVLNIFLSLFTRSKNVLSCGLVGFSGTKDFDLLKIKFLLYWNSVIRHSTDATGIYTPKSEAIVKDNIRAELFVNNKSFMEKVIADNLLVAHVRAKTFGVNSVANAHPFKYGNLIGEVLAV